MFLLPPIISPPCRRVYNEGDAADLIVLEVAQRVQILFNTVYSTLQLHWQREWSYFNGQNVDASIDLVWRIVADHSISPSQNSNAQDLSRADEWEQGKGRHGQLPQTAREQSQQLSRYLGRLGLHYAQITDILTTISVRLQEPPMNLFMDNARYSMGIAWKAAKADVKIARNSNKLDGDSVLKEAAVFLYFALKDTGWIL